LLALDHRFIQSTAMKHKPPFADPNVEKAYAEFPEDVRDDLLTLRALIFETAHSTDRVGEIEETLKWGQPAYLTPQTKSGSTIRLGTPKQGGFAIYTHCQTTIMSNFQALFPTEFSFDGNRAVQFQPDAPLPLDGLRLLIKSALTYHLK